MCAAITVENNLFLWGNGDYNELGLGDKGIIQTSVHVCREESNVTLLYLCLRQTEQPSLFEYILTKHEDN